LPLEGFWCLFNKDCHFPAAGILLIHISQKIHKNLLAINFKANLQKKKRRPVVFSGQRSQDA